jgi:hypothetical protein
MKSFRSIASLVTSVAAVAVASVHATQNAPITAAVVLAVGAVVAVGMYRSPIVTSAVCASALTVGLGATDAWIAAIGMSMYTAAVVAIGHTAIEPVDRRMSVSTL